MKTIAFAASLLTMPVSQLAPPSASLIIQCGALAILAWVVGWTAKAFTQQLKESREERESMMEERLTMSKAQEEARRDYRESLSNLTSSMDALTASLVRWYRKP